MKRFAEYVRTREGRFATYTGSEKVSGDKSDPASRFVGTDSLTRIFKADTPGYGVETARPETGEAKDK